MNVTFCDKNLLPIGSYIEHSHKNWEIIYNLSGENLSKIGENTYHISPNDIMVIPPETPHDGNSDGLYTDMYVQADKLDFCGVTVIHDHDGNILTLFNMLHRMFWQKENNYANICDALLDSMCQYIKKYTTENYRHTFIYKLKNYLFEKISNPDFRITDMAAYSGYDIDYIRRSFYAEIGTTPSKYLVELRISLAKRLLLQESFVSIRDVAAKCGFSDSFYFSTLFRKRTGLTPSQYRKKDPE